MTVREQAKALNLKVGDMISWDEVYEKNEFGIITDFGLEGVDDGFFIRYIDSGERAHIAYEETMKIYTAETLEPRHHAILLGVDPRCQEQ